MEDIKKTYFKLLVLMENTLERTNGILDISGKRTRELQDTVAEEQFPAYYESHLTLIWKTDKYIIRENKKGNIIRENRRKNIYTQTSIP